MKDNHYKTCKIDYNLMAKSKQRKTATILRNDLELELKNWPIQNKEMTAFA